VAEGLEGDHHRQEDDGEHGQEDGEGDLVRSLLPVALHQADHPVEEGLAPLGGDPDHDAVGEHLGPTGDRRPVASGLADDRRGLAGDGRLVDRGDAFGDLAVGGDEVAGLAHDQVTFGQLRRRHQFLGPVGQQAPGLVSERIRRSVSAWALPGPRPCLGEVGEEDREEQPDGDGPGEVLGWAMASMRVMIEPTSTTNMTGCGSGQPG